MAKRANGEGSVYRRKDGRWRARFAVHTSKGPKRRAFYGKTRKEANEKMLAAMGKPFDETAHSARNLSVGEWLGTWLASTKATVGVHTHERYAQVVKHDLEPALGAVKLQRLTDTHVEDFRDDMLSRSAPATVKYALEVLSTAMGRATRSTGACASRTRCARRSSWKSST